MISSINRFSRFELTCTLKENLTRFMLLHEPTGHADGSQAQQWGAQLCAQIGRFKSQLSLGHWQSLQL